MVGLDEQGRHSFGSLQNITTSKAPLRFYVFDLLNINGEDLTKSTLQKRRERLEEGFTSQVELSPILPGDARTVLAHVKEFEFEGVVAKRLDFGLRARENVRRVAEAQDTSER
jgi:bifunctional non-homologous end joining protein LigD